MSHSTAVRCKLAIFIIWSLPMNSSTRNNNMMVEHIYAIIISIIFLISISYLHIFGHSHKHTHIVYGFTCFYFTDNVIRNQPNKGSIKHSVT